MPAGVGRGGGRREPPHPTVLRVGARWPCRACLRVVAVAAAVRRGARRGGARAGGGGAGGGGRALEAAGADAEGLALLRDAQQLDLTAGQDEVAVEGLGAHATTAAASPRERTPTQLHHVGTRPAGHSSAAAAHARRRGEEVQLPRALSATGVVVAVCGEEDLG